MNRTQLFGTAMACTLAAAVSVGAQDRPTTSPSDQSKIVTVTGCLKTGPASASASVGTSGTPTASASARTSFIIADAVIKDPAAPSATGTSGSATTPGAPAGKTYSLTGGSPTELQTLVNSKVEIKGTLESKGMSATASTPPTGTPTATAKSEHPELKVTSVTKIEGSCSNQ